MVNISIFSLNTVILYISFSYFIFICLVKGKNISFFTQFLNVLNTLYTTLKKKVGYCRYHIEKRYLDDYHPNDDIMQEWRHKDFRILNLSFESNHWCFPAVFEWKISITCFLKYHFNFYVCIFFFSLELNCHTLIDIKWSTLRLLILTFWIDYCNIIRVP